jgi:hypothetical protein
MVIALAPALVLHRVRTPNPPVPGNLRTGLAWMELDHVGHAIQPKFKGAYPEPSNHEDPGAVLRALPMDELMELFTLDG